MWNRLIQRKLTYRLLCLDSSGKFVTDQRRKWVSKDDLVKIVTLRYKHKGTAFSVIFAYCGSEVCHKVTV